MPPHRPSNGPSNDPLRGAAPRAAAVVLAAAGCASQGAAPVVRPQFERVGYPVAPRGEDFDVHHGVRVDDPFRGLEDSDAPPTRAWIEAENRVTTEFLSKIPERESFRARLTELWNFERFERPRIEGGRAFFRRNDGLQNQSVLFVQDEAGTLPPRVLLDPNTLSSDGTVALSGWSPSRDGKVLAYALATSGSDWNEWRFRDVETGRDLPDVLRWVKFSGASWAPDGSGVFYSRYDAPAPGSEYAGQNFHQKLCFHRIGTDQAADPVILARPDHKEWGFGGGVSEDGRWLMVHVWRGTDPKNAVFARRVGDAGPFREVFSAWDASWDWIGNVGDRFFFKTDSGAVRSRVVAVDLSRPDVSVEEVVPETGDNLTGASLVGGRLVLSYLHDAHSLVRVHDPDGRHLHDVPLPGLGSADGFDGKADRPFTYFTFTSFTVPGTIWRYDVAANKAEVWREPTVAFDPSAFETAQVFVPSKDGTRVPMFLTWKKGLVRDGSAPVLMTGYGGFNVPETPGFSLGAVTWMERGGVYALACLRGGGEYGKEWHLAGTKLRKQNVFDDFIACAEWLVREQWTSPSRLAVTGGSNGGLLIGACLTQRPDLFGACLPAVGVLDMLRYHKFTIGWAWASDYGTVDDADEFRALFAYSPLHNVKEGVCYPPTLVTTGDHDDRVVPGHSFKFAARLQEAQAKAPSCANPVLIRIDVKAGHGAGKPTAKVIEEAADRYAFAWKALGMSEADRR
ncbi:MAG: Prolyl endopeptidase [Planctomycetes bacterium]|nr:Prolyl endopeptidase [Planctomycetota bacterium]